MMRKRPVVRPTRAMLGLLACLALMLPGLANRPGFRLEPAGVAHALAPQPKVVSAFGVPGDRPRGLAWGDGSLWLVDESQNVYRLNTSGAVQSSFPITFTASGIAWEDNGLWLSDDTDRRLVRIDATGKISSTLQGAFYWPDSGVAWHGSDLYVADYNFGLIHKHRRDGSHVLSWQIPSDSGIEHPTGMVADAAGLWIGESCEGFENNIAHFSFNGDLLYSFDVGTLGQGIKDSGSCIWPEIKGLAWDGQYLWYAANDMFTVYKLDIGAASEPTPDQWLPATPTPFFVETIAVDPTNADTAYAGSNSSRVFKTTDGGANWLEVLLPVGSYYALTVHPRHPNIIYAGTAFNVVKSNSSGTSWFELPYIASASVRAIAVDPTNTTTVYAGVEGGWGVYKTISGGATWTKVLSNTSVMALAVDPARPNIVYAGTQTYSSAAGGVFRSIDGGKSWVRATSNVKISALAIDPFNTRLVYAATVDNGVLKSTDSGATWAATNTGLTHLVINTLVIDPLRPSVLYAGTQQGGVFRSVDGGVHWSGLNAGLPASANITELAVSADRGRVYALTDSNAIFKWTGPPPPALDATYARVLDQNGRPIADAQVYRNGALVIDGQRRPQLTDAAGNLILSGVQVGDTLVARLPQYRQPSTRGAHDGWAYQVELTSLRLGGDGNLQPFKVSAVPGPQTLTIKPNQALVTFNLVVSVEWDATEVYMAEIARAVRSASDFLFDLTDGQMALGQVAIYDDRDHWADADIQIATSNIVRPHAYVGGITDPDRAHVVRLGRAWDGHSGNQGAWDQPDGYRTMTHEFSHYALYLYDEYFGFVRDAQGRVLGERAASCTGPENHNPATQATNASVMDYQYTSSELAMRGVAGLWSNRCQATAQWQLNGESDWETVRRKYTDTLSPPRWVVTTPADRGGVLAGPASLLPAVLDLPQITRNSFEAGAPLRLLRVARPDGTVQRDAIVALYRLNNQVVGQGLTDTRGELDIYGAATGDTLRATTFDGGLSGSVIVGPETSLRITLQPVRGLAARAGTQATAMIPHLRVIANPGTGAGQTDLLVGIQGLGPGLDPDILATAPDSDPGFAPTLSYNADHDTYEGRLSFSAAERGTGRIRATVGVGGSLVRLQSTYRLQHVTSDREHDIFSDDGNLHLLLDPGSLPGADAYVVVMSPGALPGPLPPGLMQLGDAYDVTMSGAAGELEKPARLMLRFDRALLNRATAPDGLAIYRWEPNTHVWQAVASSLDEEHKAMVAAVQALGTYALLAPDGSWTQPAPRLTFIPVVAK